MEIAQEDGQVGDGAGQGSGRVAIGAVEGLAGMGVLEREAMRLGRAGKSVAAQKKADAGRDQQIAPPHSGTVLADVASLSLLADAQIVRHLPDVSLACPGRKVPPAAQPCVKLTRHPRKFPRVPAAGTAAKGRPKVLILLTSPRPVVRARGAACIATSLPWTMPLPLRQTRQPDCRYPPVEVPEVALPMSARGGNLSATTAGGSTSAHLQGVAVTGDGQSARRYTSMQCCGDTPGHERVAR